MTDAEALRRQFIGWQCRIRQMQMRDQDGLPCAGMRPSVTDPDGRLAADAMTVLIVPESPDERLAEFKHIVRGTGDPNIRREKAVTLMSAAYFQSTTEFDETLTALFSLDAEVATSLAAEMQCRLHFDQFNQKFDLSCDVETLPPDSPSYQFTWWHNALFNPHLAADVTVLGFRPQWRDSTAQP